MNKTHFYLHFNTSTFLREDKKSSCNSRIIQEGREKAVFHAFSDTFNQTSAYKRMCFQLKKCSTFYSMFTSIFSGIHLWPDQQKHILIQGVKWTFVPWSWIKLSDPFWFIGYQQAAKAGLIYNSITCFMVGGWSHSCRCEGGRHSSSGVVSLEEKTQTCFIDKTSQIRLNKPQHLQPKQLNDLHMHDITLTHSEE